jgi:hypothetical protein
MSVERLKAEKEMAALKEDAARLTDLKNFLSVNSNPGNRKRVEEITEELKRIESRITVLQRIL